MAVDAINDAGTTNENTILTVVNPGSTTSLLANDTGTPAPTVATFQAVSAQGAAVTVNTNGTFTYNPTAAPALQKLSAGDSLVDTFTYSATDGVFNVDGRMRVQLLTSTTPVPGNDTNNWLNVFNALDGGAGPTGSVAGFNIVNNQNDTETTFNYGPGGDYGSDLALNTINNNDGPGGGPGPFNGTDDYAIRGRTFLRFPAAGTFTIAMGSDDGRRVRLTPAYTGSAPGFTGFSAVGGQLTGTFTAGDTVFGFSGGTGHDWSVGTFTVTAGSILALDAFFYQGNGGHSGEIAIASGTFADWTNTTDFPLLAGGTLGIQVSSTGLNLDTATVSITVNGVNDAPVAGPDTDSTNEDTAVSRNLTAAVPGMNVAVYRGTGDKLGTLDTARAGLPSHTGSVLTADFPGDNSSTINGGQGHFNNPNAVPGGAGNNYGVLLTGSLRVTTPGAYTFGTYSDDASRIRIDLNKNGVVATDGSEDIVTQPNCCGDVFSNGVNLLAGEYLFEAMYTEGGGGDYGEFFYAPGTFPGAVGFANLPFRILGDAGGGIETYQTTQPGLLYNDTDEEFNLGTPGQSLSITAVNGVAGLTGTSTMGAKVTLTATGGYTYDPNVPGSAVQTLSEGQVADDTFTYTISDNAVSGAKTSTATVKITVTGRNDAPDANNNSYTTTEDASIVTTDIDVAPRNGLGDSTPGNLADDGLLVNDTDIDAADTLSVVPGTITSAQGATVTLNANGTFTYNPTGAAALQSLGAGQSLVDTFTYTMTDNLFSPDGVFSVQLLAAAAPVPGNITANWLNIWNAVDAGATTGTIAGFNITTNLRDTETTFNYADAASYGGTLGINSINNNGPGLAGGFAGADDYSIRTRSFLRFTTGGTFTLAMGSDDGRRVSLAPVFAGSAPGYSGFTAQGGQVDGPFVAGQTVVGFSGGTGHNWSVGTFTVAAGDLLALDAFYYEGNGGDSGEIAIASGTFGGWTNTTDFPLLANGVLGIQLSSTPTSRDTATVSITVNGVNDAPVANDDAPFSTNENTPLVLTAGGVPGMNVAVYDGSDDTMPSADTLRGSSTTGAPVNPPHGTGTLLVADLGSNTDGSFLGQSGVPAPGGGDTYAVFITGILRVNNASNPGNVWTFGTHADDSNRIRIDLDRDGILEGSLTTQGGESVVLRNGCCGSVLGTPVVIPDGDYLFEAMYSEGVGGDYGEFFYAPGNPAFSTSNYALIGDGSKGISSFRAIQGLLVNDFDIDTGDSIAVDTAPITSTKGATITPLANGSFTYDPSTSNAAQLLKDGETLTDTFIYTLRDSKGGTDTATVTVVVNGISDAVNDSYNVNEDITLSVPIGTGVIANDALPGNPAFTVVRAESATVTGPTKITTKKGGEVTISPDGSFSYDQKGIFNSLPLGKNGTDSFDYEIATASVGAPATGTVTTQSSAGAFAVSATDLLSGITPTVTGTALGGQEGTSSNPAVLSNGTFGTAAAVDGESVSISNNTTLTYKLNTVAVPSGYDIAQIKTYSGWRDNGRDNQDYTVEYETVASPGTWVNFATGAVSFAPGTPPSGEVTISSPTGLLATGVGQIRFVFGTQENGYVGYRELDVFGVFRSTATVNLTINGQNDAPTAEANGPYSIGLGQDLAVTGVGSTDPDTGTALQYGWDLDNNGTVDYTSAPPPANTTAAITIPWSALQSLPTPLGAGTHTIRLIVSDGITTAFDTAALTISDTFTFAPAPNGVDDGYLLILNPAQTIIEIRDTPTNTLITSVPKAGTNSVVFTGNSDNETLTIDFTNTTPIPVTSGVTFNAAAGTDGIVYRNGTVGTVAENYSTEISGSTTIDSRVVTYTGLDTLTDTLTAPTRTLTFAGGTETVTLQNLVAGTSLQIDSDSGVITSFNRPTDSLAINLATGSSDALTINSATLAGNFTVNGSDGNDNVNVNGAVSVVAGATLPGLVSISGNSIAFVAGSITTPNNVNLTAAGTINSTTAATDVSAAALTAASATGVDLDTSVATLSATASTAGATVVIDEASAVTLLNVTTNNAAIAITTTGAGDVTAENVNSGTAATSIIVNNGNLVSGAADPAVADIVAGNLTLALSTGARNYGVSAANRLEINATQLMANTAGGANNSAFIVDIAGGLQMTNSSLGATGVTVFDLLVQNGNLTGVNDGVGDLRAIQVIVAVSGATSTIGGSAAAPLEINAATLNPAARFDATTAGAATSHVWVTDVADNFPIGTINAGLADVFLTSATGSIVDNVADSVNDIAAGRLVLTATAGGIGNGANGNLETMLGSLEATAGTGGVALANTGDLIIGGVSGAVGASATGGGVTISSSGSLTVSENVTATGAISLVTNDLSTAGQDLSIGANVTVSATTSVTLNAGDNFSMGANSTINSPSSPLVINIDSGSADTNGGALTIPNTATLNTPSATFNGANAGAATDTDTFTFAPLTTVPIVVNGFNPTSGAGDVLNLDLAGATGTTLTIDGLNDGTYTFTNRASVEYNSIEVLSAIAGSYDLVLNMSGFGTPGDFTIRRNSPFVGANLEIVNNTNSTIPFAGNIASIASLTVLGTTGNDRLVIDDGNGMVSFDPLLTPTAVFPDNPNGAGAPRLLFSAGTGVDTLIFNLTEAGAAQTYNIGSGSGPGAGDGEVSTTNTAGRNLVTYFTGFGTDGSNVVRSGSSATGGFTVAGDTNGNTINVQSNSIATRVDPVGYTPFSFLGNSFGTLGVDGGAGADTLNLISLAPTQTNPLAVVFNGGTDADTLRVQSTSNNSGTVTLNGGLGNDLFQLFDFSNSVDGITGQVVVDGTDGNVGGNADRLVIVDTGDATGDSVLLAPVDAAISQDYKLDGLTGAGAGIDDVIIRNIDDLEYTGTSGVDTIDARLSSTSPMHDLTFVTLNGWLGGDQFLLFTSDQVGGSGPPELTPTGVPSGVAVVTLNGDAPGNPNAGDGNDVFGATPPGLVGTGSNNVGLTVPDTVRAIRPSTTTGIDINGGRPTGPQPPTGDTIGDSFNLDLSGLPSASYLILPTASGVVGASGLAPIAYAEIEDINLFLNNQLINVQMGDTLVRGTDDNDLIVFSRNTAAGLGPNGARIRVNTDFVDVVLSGKTLTFARNGNDYVTQSNVTRPAEMYGEAGNDDIFGGTQNDFLVGGLGNDKINASQGDNVVWGDDSPTTAVPNPQDLAVGGDDILSGLGGNDVFYGGGGDDAVSAGGGSDYASGGEGDDTLGGSDGDDRLYGGVGNDVLGGGAGNDLLSGGSDNDILIGNTGNDVIFGGTGTDDLSGNEGTDLLITGSVANENSSRTSVPSVGNYGVDSYANPADNDFALLTLLNSWAGAGTALSRSSLAAITHDGVDDDIYGDTGDDDFCWEMADILDQGGKLTPPDYNAPNMGADERFGPT